MSGIETPYYPVFLDISNKTCLVAGGGRVAERKVRLLLKFHALITVVSPEVTRYLSGLAEKGRIEIRKRGYEESDLEGAALIFAATDNGLINARIKADAEREHIPVNVVDRPELCDFIVPSVVKRGPIVVAVSTSGTLPSLSKRLRTVISAEITRDYIKYAHILGEFRKHLIETEKNKAIRKAVMTELGRLDIEEVNRIGLREIKSRFLKSHT